MGRRMNTKQVIVMRERYPDGNGGTTGLRKGKLAAQASHASIAWLTRRMIAPWGQEAWGCKYTAVLKPPEIDWLSHGFTKIVLGVETEEELIDTYERAKAAGIEAHLITDSGLTEFGGVPTKTAVGLGPDYEDRIDMITGPEVVTCLGKKYKLL